MELFASSELDRDEWIDVIRKYSVQSSIENAYIKSSKLGSGILKFLVLKLHLGDATVFVSRRVICNCLQMHRAQYGKRVGGEGNCEEECLPTRNQRP